MNDYSSIQCKYPKRYVEKRRALDSSFRKRESLHLLPGPTRLKPSLHRSLHSSKNKERRIGWTLIDQLSKSIRTNQSDNVDDAPRYVAGYPISASESESVKRILYTALCIPTASMTTNALVTCKYVEQARMMVRTRDYTRIRSDVPHSRSPV